MVESCFLILSDSLCLLIGAFRPLTFKVILERVGLIPTEFVTFLSSCSLFLFLSSRAFLPSIVSAEHFVCFHASLLPKHISCTGVPHCIALCFIAFCRYYIFFFKWKVFLAMLPSARLLVPRQWNVEFLGACRCEGKNSVERL